LPREAAAEKSRPFPRFEEDAVPSTAKTTASQISGLAGLQNLLAIVDIWAAEKFATDFRLSRRQRGTLEVSSVESQQILSLETKT
jgi:hypothetical protein